MQTFALNCMKADYALFMLLLFLLFAQVSLKPLYELSVLN